MAFLMPLVYMEEKTVKLALSIILVLLRGQPTFPQGKRSILLLNQEITDYSRRRQMIEECSTESYFFLANTSWFL